MVAHENNIFLSLSIIVVTIKIYFFSDERLEEEKKTSLIPRIQLIIECVISHCG